MNVVCCNVLFAKFSLVFGLNHKSENKHRFIVIECSQTLSEHDISKILHVREF